MIGILFVVGPRIVAEDRIDLQQTKKENQPADQLVARDIAHAVIVIVESEIALEPQHTRLLGYLAFVAQDILTHGTWLAVGISHIVVCGANHVAGVTFLDQFGYGSTAE